MREICLSARQIRNRGVGKIQGRKLSQHGLAPRSCEKQFCVDASDVGCAGGWRKRRLAHRQKVIPTEGPERLRRRGFAVELRAITQVREADLLAHLRALRFRGSET